MEGDCLEAVVAGTDRTPAPLTQGVGCVLGAMLGEQEPL